MCDAACRKIIINSGFMAALAPLIDGPEASALATAARVLQDVAAARGYSVLEPSEDFDGCEQAKLLVHWITGDNGPVPDAADRMNVWTAEIWQQIADLVSGSTPGAKPKVAG